MPKSREPSTELHRLDAEFDKIEPNIKQWLKGLPNGYTVYDFDIGGGQLAKITESCYNSIVGYASNELFLNIASTQRQLSKGTYQVSGIDANDKETFKEKMIKFIKTIEADWSKVVVIGNPAYTIGQGRTPIYNVSLEVLEALGLAGLLYIIPYKWMSQIDTGVGKEVRNSLKKLGIKLIIINPLDLFKDTGVKTETCTVICERGYKGPITVTNNDGTLSFSLTQKEFDDRIWPFFNQDKKNLLIKHRQTESSRIFFDKSTDSNGYKKKYQGKWIPKTSYQKEGYDKNPINRLTPLFVKNDRKTTDMVAGGMSFNNKQNCQTYCDYWNSYLFSKPIQWHFKNTRMSTTLDGPQFDYVPNFINNNPTQIYTDKDIYKLGGYTPQEIKLIEDDC